MKANKAWRVYVAVALLGGWGGAWIGGVWQEPGIEERLRTAEVSLLEQYHRQADVEQYAKLSQKWQALTQEEQGTAQQHSRACKGYGDCLFLGAQYEHACAAYREALRWDGDNEGARLNLCLAMERLPQNNPPSQQQPSQQPPSQQQQEKQQQEKQSRTSRNSPRNSPDESGKRPSGGGEQPSKQPPEGQNKQPVGSTGVRSGSAPQPATEASGDRDSERQLLRHLVEQERDRSRMNIENRNLKPPRGTETW